MTDAQRMRREEGLYRGVAQRRELCHMLANAEYKLSRTARHVIVSDPATDCATGHCECGACGGAVDPWDAWCRWCGVRLEDA